MHSSGTLTFENLDPQQQRCVVDCSGRDHVLLIAPMGFGKCAIGMFIAERWGGATLVVGPKRAIELTWGAEWKKWGRPKPVILVGSLAERNRAFTQADLTDKSKVMVCTNPANVAGVISMFPEGYFQNLIFDETTMLKAPGSKLVKLLRRKRTSFKRVLGLSGTPVEQNVYDLYGQMLVVDGGETLGTRVAKFAAKYFKLDGFGRFAKLIPMPGAEQEIANAIAPNVYTVPEDYQHGLPVLEDILVQVEMPEESWKVYEELVRTGVAITTAGELVPANAAVLSGKLRQLANGILYQDAETCIEYHDAKLRALDKIYKQLDPLPVLVAYEFETDRERLKEWFPECETELTPEVVERWNNGEIEMLAVHPKSGGHGLNLQQGGWNMVFLTPPWSKDLWSQFTGRLLRRGQPSDEVHRYRIETHGTVDGLAYERYQQKAESADAFTEHLRKILGA